MLYVCLTFDWEGEHFNNIHEFKSIMDGIGTDIPVTHFICPAYFTGKIPRAENIINATVKKIDEIGLHVHCYRSLIQAAGVEFRTEPDYYKQHSGLRKTKDILSRIFPHEFTKKLMQAFISGRGVPLSAYKKIEIETILKFSAHVLSNTLNREIQSFRSGGWLANDTVYEALISTGILVDSSAVPPQVVGKTNSYLPDEGLTDDYGEAYPVFSDFVRALWGNSLQSTGFLSNSLRFNAFNDNITYDTFSFDIHSLKVLVNNFGMSDFVTFKQTIKPWLENIQDLNDQDYVINYGCHQEGAFFYKKPVLDLVRYLRASHQKEISFVTISELNQIMRTNNFENPWILP